jgi:predicted metalloprotease with PDZ domain
MKNLKPVLAFAGMLATALPSFAQHEHHAAPDTTSQMPGHPVKGHDMKNMDQSHLGMTHTFSLSLPMTRNGSAFRQVFMELAKP